MQEPGVLEGWNSGAVGKPTEEQEPLILTLKLFIVCFVPPQTSLSSDSLTLHARRTQVSGVWFLFCLLVGLSKFQGNLREND